MPTPTHVNAYDTEYWRDISSKTFKLKGPQKISKYEIDFGLDIELSNRDIVQMSEDMMLLSPEIVPVIQQDQNLLRKLSLIVYNFKEIQEKIGDTSEKDI